MTEFKLSPGLADEIDAMRISGQGINSSASELTLDGIDTLKTSVRYIEQHKAITDLMTLYANLLAKDANDLDEMMANVHDVDNTMGGGFR